MITKMKWFGVVTMAALPLVAGRGQNLSSPDGESVGGAAPPSAAVVAGMTASAHPGVAEVLKLSRSGVGDDVIVAYVRNSRKPYYLSANDVLALKNAGLSSPVVTAMLEQDRMMLPKAAPRTPPPPAYPPAPGSVPSAMQPATPPSYTYEQRLYAPVPGASAPLPPSASAPVSPGVMQPGDPALPGQPVMPAQAALAPQAPVIVDRPPPPPQLEVVPVSPGVDYYWTPGYWGWRGGAWVWVGGCWLHRPYRGAVWVGGHWGWHGRGYVWIGGRWR